MPWKGVEYNLMRIHQLKIFMALIKGRLLYIKVQEAGSKKKVACCGSLAACFWSLAAGN